MKKGLYGILDNQTGELIGSFPITVHRTATTAVRLFDDLARSPNNQVNQHIKDHDLVRIGYLEEVEAPDEDGNIQPLAHPVLTHDYEVVLTGEAWALSNSNREKP